jgi:hypothetical protein
MQRMEMNMNRFLTAMAFAIAVGSTPALAQSWDPDVGSGNIAPPPYGETDSGASIYQHDGRGFNAHAQATPRHTARHAAKLNRSNVVTDDNQVVGADPDISVRSELMRDNKETEF